RSLRGLQAPGRGTAAGGFLGRLVSRLARSPGICRDRRITPKRQAARLSCYRPGTAEPAVPTPGRWQETMFEHEPLITLCGLIGLAAPVLLLCVLGLSSLLGRPLRESTIGQACSAATLTGLVAAVVVLALMLAHGTRHEAIEVGDWVVIPN